MTIHTPIAANEPDYIGAFAHLLPPKPPSLTELWDTACAKAEAHNAYRRKGGTDADAEKRLDDAAIDATDELLAKLESIGITRARLSWALDTGVLAL